MNKNFKILIGSLVVVSVFGLSQCKKSSVVAVPPNPYLLELKSSATLGSYLADKDGKALYSFANDANIISTSTTATIPDWPAFFVSGFTASKLGAGLVATDFDSVASASGKQLTYKGWPLYYYAPGGVRETSGMTTGDGIEGKWFVAKPDYSIMLANLQLVGANGKSYVYAAPLVYTEGTAKSLYFTDPLGRALYTYAPDSANINKWTLGTVADAAHNAFWPIYGPVQSPVVVPSVLDKALFGSITVFGNPQMTYKGWPIYYFKSDVSATGVYRGFNKGVSIGIVGTTSLWPIIFKDIPAAPTK